MINKDQLLQKLNNYLESKGLAEPDKGMDAETRIKEYGLKAMSATKNILEDIYTYQPPSGKNILRFGKNFVIKIIRNVTVSTIELLVIKQNKFNELTYQQIEYLQKENQELKDRLAQLEKKK